MESKSSDADCLSPVARVQTGGRGRHRSDVDSHGDRRDRRGWAACARWKRSSQAVSLGKDTFSDRGIRKSTIEECVRVLKSYRKILEEYQITNPEHIRVVATSAVREARNRLAFIDRVYIATGMEVEPIDEAEVNRVTYLGVQPYLQDESFCATARTIVTEVGGGSTEIAAGPRWQRVVCRHVPARIAAPAQIAGRLPRPAGQSAQDHGEPDPADGGRSAGARAPATAR